MTFEWDRKQKVQNFVRRAIEASVYSDPSDFGLTQQELIDVGSQLGFGAGEIRDTLRSATVGVVVYNGERWLPDTVVSLGLIDFSSMWQADPRNPKAFQFVLDEFESLAREEGAANAKIDRASLLERGEAQGYSKGDLELAITAYKCFGMLTVDEDGVLSRSPSKNYASPEYQRRQQTSQRERTNAPSDSILSAVADVTSKRDQVPNPRKTKPPAAAAKVPRPTKKSKPASRYEPFDRGRLLSRGFDAKLVDILEERLAEADLCDGAEAHLAATAMYGSVLEGVLYGLAKCDPQIANQSSRAPKEAGKVKKFSDWKFVDYVSVAVDVGWIPRSVAGHADELRDSRNLIHVRKQFEEGFGADGPLVRVTKEVLYAILDHVREL